MSGCRKKSGCACALALLVASVNLLNGCGGGGSGGGVTGGGGGANVPTATHFSVVGPPNIPSGIPFTFTVTAQDVSNNLVTTYSGTLRFSSTDLQAQLPGNAPLTSGLVS